MPQPDPPAPPVPERGRGFSLPQVGLLWLLLLVGFAALGAEAWAQGFGGSSRAVVLLGQRNLAFAAEPPFLQAALVSPYPLISVLMAALPAGFLLPSALAATVMTSALWAASRLRWRWLVAILLLVTPALVLSIAFPVSASAGLLLAAGTAGLAGFVILRRTWLLFLGATSLAFLVLVDVQIGAVAGVVAVVAFALHPARSGTERLSWMVIAGFPVAFTLGAVWFLQTTQGDVPFVLVQPPPSVAFLDPLARVLMAVVGLLVGLPLLAGAAWAIADRRLAGNERLTVAVVCAMPLVTLLIPVLRGGSQEPVIVGGLAALLAGLYLAAIGPLRRRVTVTVTVLQLVGIAVSLFLIGPLPIAYQEAGLFQQRQFTRPDGTVASDQTRQRTTAGWLRANLRPGDQVLVADGLLLDMAVALGPTTALLAPYEPAHSLALQDPCSVARFVVGTDGGRDEGFLSRLAPCMEEVVLDAPGYRIFQRIGD